MNNRIITISREFGSGGREIGRKVAEKLGIPCYDTELVYKLVQESGFSEEYVKNESEYAPVGGIFSMALATNRLDPLSNQDKLWIAQSNVIRQLAEEGACVIVGRGADYILDGKADLLTVFIHADMELRAARIESDSAEYGHSKTPALRRLKEKDKRRAAYYQFYTDRKWGRAQNYHICLDSGVLGIDRCVDIIASLY